jgi:hypothetical protein
VIPAGIIHNRVAPHSYTFNPLTHIIMDPLLTPPLINPPSNHRWFLGVLAALLLLPFLAVVLLAMGVTSYFRLSSDTQALRSGLIKASGAEWRQQFAFNLGGWTCGAVRSGMSFVNLNKEARAATQAVRGVEVSVLRLASGDKAPDRAIMLNAADSAMSKRGWDRVVGVVDGDDMVAVYVSNKTTSCRRIECCVVVFDGEQMIVASARANLQPLLECVRDRSDWRAKIRFPT